MPPPAVKDLPTDSTPPLRAGVSDVATRASMRAVASRLLATFRRLGPAGPLAILVSVVPPLGLIALVTLCGKTSLPALLRDHPTVGIPAYAMSFWFLGICFVP